MVSETGNGIIEIGNGIIETGNGIISPTYRPLIQKLLLQSLICTLQGFRNWFQKQEMELLKQEMELLKQEIELYLPPTGLQSKNFFGKV